MLTIRKFTFNPFSENTYVVSDETGDCIIVDPGCYNADERNELDGYISTHHLHPVKLVLTHCHIDHVLGMQHVAEKYGIPIYAHQLAPEVLSMLPQTAMLFGFPSVSAPEPDVLLDEKDTLEFGHTRFQILHCPGHSPDSIVFYQPEEKTALSGDVLFYGSIGRPDLPGGNLETLLSSIRNKLFTLPDEVTVYSGHGPETTIGHEKRTNPFLQ